MIRSDARDTKKHHLVDAVQRTLSRCNGGGRAPRLALRITIDVDGRAHVTFAPRDHPA